MTRDGLSDGVNVSEPSPVNGSGPGRRLPTGRPFPDMRLLFPTHTAYQEVRAAAAATYILIADDLPAETAGWLITSLPLWVAGVIGLRHGLVGDGRCYTLNEIGTLTGVTKERVRQIDWRGRREIECRIIEPAGSKRLSRLTEDFRLRREAGRVRSQRTTPSRPVQ